MPLVNLLLNKREDNIVIKFSKKWRDNITGSTLSKVETIKKIICEFDNHKKIRSNEK